MIRLAFKVSAQHLLTSSDDTHLHRGRQVAVRMQVRSDRGFVQQAGHGVRRFILAEHGDKPGPSAQGAHVARHVGSPSQALLRAADADNRNRCFRRDAIHIAEPVAIQHHIASNEDATLGKLFTLWKRHGSDSIE
jgi:hypothetical protein